MAISWGGTWWWSMIEDHKFILYNMQNDQVSLLGMISFFYNGTVVGVQKSGAKNINHNNHLGIGATKNTQRKIMAVNLPSSTGELLKTLGFPAVPPRCGSWLWQLYQGGQTCIDCPFFFFESRNRNGNAESPWILVVLCFMLIFF